MVDFSEVCRRWQKRWADEKVFEAVPDGRPKFFVTFPYPYMNGYLHLGHLYTLMRIEAFARYKRMRGFNVLFPQGWHATGSPVEAAAKRVAEGEPKELKILKDMGFSDKDIPKFADPLHWIKTFTKGAEEDYKALGVSVDWRRTFVTTDINPHYSKFIQWQFRTLKSQGRVIQGSYPVVWCPKEQLVVQDHGRSQGEGVMPEEMVLIKFRMGEFTLPAATFRPETAYGVTNMWLNPELTYVEARVDNEYWLISEPAAAKLADQKHNVKIVRKFSGRDFIGKLCTNPVTQQDVPILPASFVSPDVGTGVVMSVPSHAPYDYIALADIQANPQKAGLNPELVKNIKPISLIMVPGYGEHPAIETCKRMGIKSQADTAKLEEATSEVYKKEFHTGRLKENTGAYKGLSIQEAKPKIIADFQKQHIAALMHELAETVICRCLARCHAKIVENQWFIKYGDPAWKKLTGEALAACKMYPEKAREQFLHTLDWLHDWPCARSSGLGTRLPWDERWIIEALSDSTLYPAYYTIAHLVKDVPVAKLTDAFFDYVFLGKGSAKDAGVDPALAERMHQEFTYWYPCDFRNSGKDLVQNHLTFYLFNHAAIFLQKHWPAGIGVNGWINVDGQKMSKSKGNFLLLRDTLRNGTDQARLTVLMGGEGLDDSNWENQLAQSMTARLDQWYAFALEHYGHGSDERGVIDDWMESQLNSIIRDTTHAMDETRFRTALMRGFFDLQRQLKWYIRRKAGQLNKQVVNAIIEAQTKLLAPFAPHLCEEIWFKIGKKTLISKESWPAHDEAKVHPTLDAVEGLVAATLDDMHAVLKLAKLDKPKKVTMYAAEDWKHDLMHKMRELMGKTRNASDIIKACLAEAALKQHAKDVPVLVQKLVKDPSKVPVEVLHQEAELRVLEEAAPFFSQECGCPVQVVPADKAAEAKAKQALPGKPAILVA